MKSLESERLSLSEVVKFIAGIALSLFVITVLLAACVSADADALCRRSLMLEKDVSGGLIVTIKVKFSRGEYANTATATSVFGTHVRTDVNKSRVIGEVIGNKSKEVAKGLIDGIRSKSKH